MARSRSLRETKTVPEADWGPSSLASEIRFPVRGEGPGQRLGSLRQRPVCICAPDQHRAYAAILAIERERKLSRFDFREIEHVVDTRSVSLAMAWHNHAAWHAVRVSTIPEHDDGDVQGLAKLGIANLPGHQPPPAGEPMHPMLAGK